MMFKVLALCAVLGFSAASACGGAESGESGSIQTPNWPRRYGSDENCEWTITVPAGSRVELSFETFDIESATDGSCPYDKLVIWDGDNADATMIGDVRCGRRIPEPIEASGNTLYVHFTSDDVSEHRGFKADWKAV